MENNDLLKMISQAKELLNNGPLNEFKNYAPIYNSRIMLNNIRQAQKKESFTENELARINIGLLAAKSLDFDTRFNDYADILHDIWLSFLTSIPNLLIPAFSPGTIQQAVYDFYKKHFFSHAKTMSHMQGIDFQQPIDTNCQLNSNNILSQWRIPSIILQGNYYSCISSNPTCLGIHNCGEDFSGQVLTRQKYLFRINRSVIVLKSIAASVLDTWSIKKQSFPTKGGCIQYFNKNNQYQFVPFP